MNKLTMFLLAALAAAAIGVGGLATAPSASAAKPRISCKTLAWMAEFYYELSDQFLSVGDEKTATRYGAMGEVYDELHRDNC